VAELVDRGEDPAEVPFAEVGGEPHIAGAERGRERVLGRVEPPRVGVVAEPDQELVDEDALTVERERPVQTGVVDRPRVADRVHERRGLAAQLLEDLCDVGGRRALVVVVEQHVVGIVVGREALDVPALELELPLQMGQQDAEVAPLPRLEPGGDAERAGAREVGAEVGRHAVCLLVLATSDTDERDRDGVVDRAVAVEPVEHAGELRRGDALVGHPVDRRTVLRPRRGSARRHLGLLVPEEEIRDAVQVVDLGEQRPETVESRAHSRIIRDRSGSRRAVGTRRRRRARASASRAP
jgi:hypothetical protein